MMCRVKVGFFSLRRCGERPIGTCKTCSRPMCQRHLVADPDGNLCSECAARDREDRDDGWNRDTIHRRRRGYYDSRGYRPYGYGHHSHHHHYDDHDARDFDEAAAGGAAAEALEDDGGDFFDS